MMAIGKQFTRLCESYTVELENYCGGNVISYLCRSHVDNLMWFFSVEELRRILSNQP